MGVYKYDRFIEKMQSEIDIRDEEIRRLKTTIESFETNAEAEELKELITELKNQIKSLERGMDEKRLDIKMHKSTIESLRSDLYEEKKAIIRESNKADLYRSELMRLKFTVQDEPTTIYRNAPSEDILQRSGIKVIYVEKQKHTKSKEQNAFDRQYKKMRMKALERDDYRCIECKKDEELHVHHKIHRENGGTNDLDNLETLCKWCHAEKHKGENVYNIMAKSLQVIP